MKKDKCFTIELFMYLIFDFKTEFLKLGSLCEVIEPINFRKEMIEEINKLKLNYKK